MPKIGGPWRHCEQADANLCFSGEQHGSDGKRYQHKRPHPLFVDATPGGQASAYEQLLHALKELNLTPEQNG